MTENEFIDQEVARWGWDEVDRLLAKGFEPKLTNEGWRWIMSPATETKQSPRQRAFAF